MSVLIQVAESHAGFLLYSLLAKEKCFISLELEWM